MTPVLFRVDMAHTVANTSFKKEEATLKPFPALPSGLSPPNMAPCSAHISHL